MSAPVVATDELRHAPGPESAWQETWHLSFWDRTASVGGYVQLTLFPNQGRSWFWAAVVGENRHLVTVVEPDAPLPREPGLEIRTSGLWADVIVQTPLDHMTVGLEAFGVQPEHPTEMFGRGWGDRVPLGFDLEWESQRLMGATGPARYDVACKAHGEILLGDETIDFDGFGHRYHHWGAASPWATGWASAALRMDSGQALFELSPIPRSEGALHVDDHAPSGLSRTLALDGLVEVAQLATPTGALDLTPVAWAPLTAETPGGVAHLDHALVRCSDGSGNAGVGWVAVNQPQ